MILTMFFFLVIISSFVSALALEHQPVTTPITKTDHESAPYAITAQPAPTQVPDPQELLKRQQASQQTLLAAPDSTCGYFGGSSDSPWGCTAGGNCVLATASVNATKSSGSVLCCDPSSGCPSEPAPTTCVDNGRYAYSTACTGSCRDDPMTLKCTSGIMIYCNLITFATPVISNYFCNYLSTYSPILAETTYSGQSGRSLTPTVAKFATSTSLTTSSVSISTSSAKSTESSSRPTSTSASKSKGVSNKGAIIGGVVGGFFGLVLIVGLILLCVRRRKGDGKEDGTKKILRERDHTVKASK